MKLTFFKTQAELRKWFEKNYKTETELFLGYYKVGSGKPSVSWPQSVDEALCFGWIDGVRRSVDEHSYCIRFTPRKAGSIWSAVNIKKVEELSKQGLMKPEGLAAFEKLKGSKSKIYSYEKDPAAFDPAYEKQFKANKKAWEYFQSMSNTYRKVTTHWVMSAKQEATRDKRMKELIDDSAAGVKIKSQRYGDRK